MTAPDPESSAESFAEPSNLAGTPALPGEFTGLAAGDSSDTSDTSRLLGMIVSLAAEVYGLKAELARVRLALNANGTLDDHALERAGESPAMRKWMSEEESAFGRTLLRPFTHPDEAPDVTAFMQSK